MAENTNDGKSKADTKDPHEGWIVVNAATGEKEARNADKVQVAFATDAEATAYRQNLSSDSSLVTSGAVTGTKTEKVTNLTK